MDIRYEGLVAAVERAINEADPIGLLAGGAPSDEYAPEIGTIIPLLANAHRPDDVTGVLHGEFLRWFGEGTAGPRQAYGSAGASDLGCFTRVSEERLTQGLGLGSRADEVELPRPTGDLVPTGALLVHQLQVIDSTSQESLLPRNRSRRAPDSRSPCAHRTCPRRAPESQ